MEIAAIRPADVHAESEAPQLRTILLTDICDSISLVERIGDGAAATFFREHDRLVLRLQQQWRGRLIDRSDGLLLLFERPIDGLGFAIDYARGLRELGAQRNLDLSARAGLHVGEVLTWRNSEEAVRVGSKPLEVEGLAKPIAARLMSMARPGQILLSAVAEPLAHRAARELGERGQHMIWKSHGRWRFKGMPEPHEVFEVGEPGIAPLRAPPNSAKAWRAQSVSVLWRRPAALAVQAAVVAVMAAGAWFMTRPAPAIAFNERDWVVVADLRNLTDQPLLDESLEQAFRISLEQSRHVNVLSDLKTRDTLARMQRESGTQLDRAIASEIAIRDGARAVILPTVTEVGGRVRFSAEVIDPNSQTTVYAGSADGNGAVSALTSIDAVTAQLRSELGEALKSIEHASVPLPKATTENLDALRAFALGQENFARSDFVEAEGFYLQAVSLDPQFALAHLGLVRSKNAQDRFADGRSDLRAAWSLRERMPPRERLYLDAWVAEAQAPEDALEKWKQMSGLYPDSFPALANVAYASAARNLYSQAFRYAKRAASPKNEFAPLSAELLGRMAMAIGDFKQAEASFREAASEGVDTAALRLATLYAAQRRFDEAVEILPNSSVVPGHFDEATILLDSGQFGSAMEAMQKMHDSTTAGSVRRSEAAVALATFQWLAGEGDLAAETLRETVPLALTSMKRTESRVDAHGYAAAAIIGALVAHRLGVAEMGSLVAERLGTTGIAMPQQTVTLLRVLEAENLRVGGKPVEAIKHIEPVFDGTEPFQAHTVRMQSYIDSDEFEAGVAEARWLSDNRGSAYAEHGCRWCQQPLNVADTALAHLVLAEALAVAGRRGEARKWLDRLDSHWRKSHLPDYLRVRREVVVDTFN
ncbi:MAG: putative peptide modification system cyclase [Proteobacteria bacterium]|nr:putative peptide modification system cyclase [Pseudomonadota bacterium]